MEGDQVAFSVTDTGRGIPPEYLQQIFDFVRKPMTPDALRRSVAGAVVGKPAPRPRRAAEPRSQTLTMNGFRILSPPAHSSIVAGQDHSFSVMHFPDGTKETVTVSVDAEAIARVARDTGRLLPANSTFWRFQAERLLQAFLWTEANLPPDRTLTVRDVSQKDLDIAVRWDEG